MATDEEEITPENDGTPTNKTSYVQMDKVEASIAQDQARQGAISVPLWGIFRLTLKLKPKCDLGLFSNRRRVVSERRKDSHSNLWNLFLKLFWL
jgi:hypothetical protein